MIFHYLNCNFLILRMTVVIFLICVLFKWMRCAWKRKKLSKVYPCKQYFFLNVFGDFNVLNINENYYKGISLTALMWERIIGFYQIFKNEKLFCAWVSYMPLIALNKPEAIEQVLNSTKAMQKAFVYEWLNIWLGTGLLTSYGEKWKTRRKLLTPAFHFEILKDFLPIINEKSMLFIKKLKAECSNEFIDIVQPVTMCSLDIICETTLGVDVKAQENADSDYVLAVARVSESFTRRYTNIKSWWDSIFFCTSYGKKIKRDLKLLHKFTMAAIQERKKKLLKEGFSNNNNRRKPLIEILLEHHIKTKSLTEEDIREEVDTFTFEGHDTTAMALIWSLYLIGLYKDVQRRVHQELDLIFGDDRNRQVLKDDLKDMNYLECVIKETLRLFPSVPLFGRRADNDINICGYHIPKGANIFITPFSLHRNEEIYPNAEIFDPERFTPENSRNRHPFAYIPFSAGSRNCIGQRLALMELKIVLANVLRNFTLHSLDERDVTLTCHEITLRPSVPIRIQIRTRD